MESDQGKLFIGGISWETTEEKLSDLEINPQIELEISRRPVHPFRPRLALRHWQATERAFRGFWLTDSPGGFGIMSSPRPHVSSDALPFPKSLGFFRLSYSTTRSDRERVGFLREAASAIARHFFLGCYLVAASASAVVARRRRPRVRRILLLRRWAPPLQPPPRSSCAIAPPAAASASSVVKRCCLRRRRGASRSQPSSRRVS